mmetsp:Transcript_150778/g.482533  ORF Transcript_150778/g.482533 Transcript_150778/m.482533 type:complete len:267 (+) Transcript_150778:569-1369(+)
MLRSMADRTGLAVICTPYELGTDHGAISRSVGATLDGALAAGAVRYGWAPERMPRFALGHSLGAKLQVLLRCSGNNQRPEALGVGLIAFNNFGVADSVKLLRETVAKFQGIGAMGGESFWDMVEPALGRAAKMSGLEFRPSPDELLELVRSGYAGNARTRLFRFDADNLDSSTELLDALDDRGMSYADASFLEGNHLSPVVIGLADVTQAANDRSPQGAAASRVAEQFQQRFGGAAAGVADRFRVGNEEELKRLVDALVNWVAEVR